MRIDIIVVYMPRYEMGHEFHFVSPITGIYLAALTPPHHQVRVCHQQTEPVDFDTDAQLIALAFFSGFEPEARRLAREFRLRGKTVVAGGPHVTFSPDESLSYCDAIVVGEAEEVWERLLTDAEAGRLARVYAGESPSLENAPTPRYDLLGSRYIIPRVVQATRGCPFTCSFCTVPTLNPGFRMRPVDNVLADIQYNAFRWWWQRKIVWFWDDNLTIRRPYAKELFARMIPLKRWWLTQASIDNADDPELLDLMRRSGCIGVFIGIETFSPDSLREANKRHNRIEYYRSKVKTLHAHGICVMAGLIAGFDSDTPESVRSMTQQLREIGIDVPFLSILTPFKGTPIYEQLRREGRLMGDRGLEFSNGFNVAFEPKRMSPEELLRAHRDLWCSAFSITACLRRIWRGLWTLRWGAFGMSLAMNAFYGWKALRGNLPVDQSRRHLPASVPTSDDQTASHQQPVLAR